MQYEMTNPPEAADPLTLVEVRSWFAQEVRDLTRLLELRVQEASDIVNSFAAKEMSPEETEKRLWRYQDRWGDAIPGVKSTHKMTDSQIVQKVDEATHPDFVRRLKTSPISKGQVR
jgi:cellulase/cellobiase CelA1